MTYGIIAALDEELLPLLRECCIEQEKEIYGTKIYRGSIHGRSVVLCKCGIATINAALCTSVVIREFGADCIINTGIAGALSEGVRMLDVVISTDACYYNRDAALMEKYYPFTNCFKADDSLVRRAALAAGKVQLHGSPVRVHQGRIVTGDLFVADRALKEELISRFHPLCVEMEGAAIANTAFACGRPFVIVRTMSDCADEEANENYDRLIEDAGSLSASIILKMLEEE